MKTTKWFKTGELIPSNAVYLKTENKVVDTQHEDGPMGGWNNDVYEEFHLYEIPIEPPAPELPKLGEPREGVAIGCDCANQISILSNHTCRHVLVMPGVRPKEKIKVREILED